MLKEYGVDQALPGHGSIIESTNGDLQWRKHWHILNTLSTREKLVNN